MFRTVGQRTSVKSAPGSQGGSRTRVAARELNSGSVGRARPILLRFDLPLLLLVCTLSIFGLIMLYSASYDYSLNYYGDSSLMFDRQLLFFAVGVAGAVVATILDYHQYRKLVVAGLGITLLALTALLFFGEARNNAIRGFTGGSIQPSEMAKLVIILYLAVWLYSKRERLTSLNFGLFPLMAILGAVGGLIFLQPDVSATLTVLLIGGLMFFLAGGDWKQIGLLILGAVAIGGLIYMISATAQDRVIKYLAGIEDPTLASYHVQRAIEGFVRGKWFGVGIGDSLTKLTGLPVPPTDSIFAVIAEETGLIGAVSLVILYCLLVWRGFVIARNAPDELGALIAIGLSLWIALEAFINMAVVLNLIPFAGNALPFISAGGSNLLFTLAAVGILLNISRQSISQKYAGAAMADNSDSQRPAGNPNTFVNQDGYGRFLGALVDMRRWNRGRRVPRSRRSLGAQNDE